MKVVIEIDCELKTELFSHLSVIRQQLQRELKAYGPFDVVDKECTVEDDNCYGSHTAKIVMEDFSN